MPTSQDNQLPLFNGVGEYTMKRADQTGYAKLAAGVLSVVSDIPTSDLANATDGVLTVEDHFVGGLTTSGNVGALAWHFVNGTLSQLAAENDHPGMVRRDTGAASVYLTTHLPSGWAAEDLFDMTWYVRVNQFDANQDAKFGMTGSGTGSFAPANGIYFESLTADTNWFRVCRAGGSQTREDTGVARSAGAWLKLRIRRIDASTIGFQINGGTEAQITTNIPASGTHLQPWAAISTSSASSRTYDIDYFRATVTGLPN